MKNVYSNKELCHVWANEKQESARGSNMFFENGIIYSYDKHFPIAKIYHNKRGSLILFTTHSYSNTTSKHMHDVRRAINGRSIYVDAVIIDPFGNGEASQKQYHYQNLNDFLSRIDKLIEEASQSKKYGEILLENSTEIMLDFKNYIEFFKPSLLSLHKKALQRINDNTYIPVDLLEKAKARAIEYEKKQLIWDQKRIERRKIEEARAIEEEKIALQAWINGEDKRRYFHTCALRIKDNEVQTTLGARVPIEEARKLALLIKNKQDIIGYDINGYTVISFNGTLKIGCHVIPIEEVNRMIELLLI